MKRDLERIKEIIKKEVEAQPSLELESDISESDKVKIAKWATSLGVALYFRGLNDE
jgi:hypothetical protein